MSLTTSVAIERTSSSRGFTLLELLIALAILMAIVGLTWPAVGRYLGEQPIKNAAEMSRRQLGSVRHKSQMTGLIYQFRYEPGGQRFVVLPFELDPQQVTPSENGSSATVTTGTTTSAALLEVVSGTLDPTCRFASSTDASGMFAASNITTAATTERIPEALLALLPNGSELASVSWSPPMLFYPDGTADDGALSILDEDQRTISLSLRGLTGTVTVGPMEKGGRQ